MLRAAASRRALAPVAIAARQALPTSGLLARRLAEQQPVPQRDRQLSTAPSPSSKIMGTLAVDPLASSSTVQGVEYVLTGFDSLVNWARKSSLWPMTFGLA